MQHQWWAGQPVLEVVVEGNIASREQAYQLSKAMVTEIEGSGFPHVIVILDLTALGQSPSGAALLSGNLPETLKIEHLVMINAPNLLRVATMPLFHLRNKFHFVTTPSAARDTAKQLLPNLPR